MIDGGLAVRKAARLWFVTSLYIDSCVVPKCQNILSWAALCPGTYYIPCVCGLVACPELIVYQ